MSNIKYAHIGDPLDKLVEECAEVIQSICKVKRFGAESINPYDVNKQTNRERVISEIMDLETRIVELKNTDFFKL